MTDPRIREQLREIRRHMPLVRPAHWFRVEPHVQTMGGEIAVADVYRSRGGLVALVTLDQAITVTHTGSERTAKRVGIELARRVTR